MMKFIGMSQEPHRIVGVVPNIDDENVIPQRLMLCTIHLNSEQQAAVSSSSRTPIPTR